MTSDNKESLSVFGSLEMRDEAGNEVWSLSCGEKLLSVVIYGNGSAICRVEKNDKALKLEGSTTALYRRAKDIMKRNVASYKRDIVYTFSSYSGGMLYWATHQGRELFNWESERLINESVDGCELLECIARIKAK